MRFDEHQGPEYYCNMCDKWYKHNNVSCTVDHQGDCCHHFEDEIDREYTDDGLYKVGDNALQEWQYTINGDTYKYDSVEQAIVGLMGHYEELLENYERIHKAHENQRDRIHELWDQLDTYREYDSEPTTKTVSVTVVQCPQHGMIKSWVNTPGITTTDSVTHCPMYSKQGICNRPLDQAIETREITL